MKNVFKETEILIPENIDMFKWSVVACDQYTSEPKYWEEVQNLIGDSPSTYNITLPEIFLKDNVEAKVENINQTMKDYLDKDVFKSYPNTMIYIERTQKDGRIRQGLVGAIDLEEYDYNIGSTTLIRATEKTVVDRIPPRVKIRENALLELPHIMILIDDEKKNIIESLKDKVSLSDKIYDFDLMMNGGHIKGYTLDKNIIEEVKSKLESLGSKDYFNKKYDLKDKEVLLYAMGDGNHSLATAKACYENLKKTMDKKDYLNHPARYALVELVNLHSEALEFEAIHRVVFNINVNNLFDELAKYYDISYEECDGQKIEYITKEKSGYLWIKNPKSNITVGSLQLFLDDYLKNNFGEIDYVHGKEVTKQLATEDNCVGFLLPVMGKSELFKTVILDGALPRKTFSMGHANDKRFYLESRKIK